MADLEKGLWGSNVTKSYEPPLVAEFVTAMVKGDSGNHWMLKGGDAQTGDLATFYDGPRPRGANLPGGGRYSPMRKEGAVILGVGGDNSNGGVGSFVEGAIARGFTSDATDAAVQASVVAARYRRP